VISDISAPERNDPLGFRQSGMKPSAEAAAAIALIRDDLGTALFLELFSTDEISPNRQGGRSCATIGIVLRICIFSIDDADPPNFLHPRRVPKTSSFPRWLLHDDVVTAIGSLLLPPPPPITILR
jgi:hypothetical protein